jgi:hypothetical protein
MSEGIGGFRSALIAVGGLAAVSGLYWDDAWHTDVGRDTFFAPPHLLLYAGVMLMLIAAVWWARDRWRVEGWSALRDPVLALPLVGASVTLAAAPVDELWHQLFGKDAVQWSPPHMVAVAGMFAFAAGLYLAVRRTEDTSAFVSTVVGAFLIAAAVTPVMEFETDVPQFPVVMYWPVLIGMLTLAFSLIGRASDRPWAATEAATVYVLLRVGVLAFLAPLGHSLPTVMPTFAAAWAFDLVRRRDAGRVDIAVAVSAATLVSHLVAHVVQPAGLTFQAADVILGGALGALAAWVVVSGFVERGRAVDRRRAGATLAIVIVLLVVGWSAPALAHDPGQGEDVAEVVLDAARDRDTIAVTVAAATGPCEGWEPVQVLARRAGRTYDAPLEEHEPCRYAGEVTVDDPGRWFVYAEIVVDEQLTEAWIPVEEESQRKETVQYLAPVNRARTLQVVAGVGLYAVVFALFAGVVVVYRRSAPAEVSR